MNTPDDYNPPDSQAWQEVEHLENPEKNAKNDFFEKKGPNMILGAHHNNIKNDDFHNLQHWSAVAPHGGRMQNK